MRIPNIYTSSPLGAEQIVELDDNAVRHLAQSLRVKTGFNIQLFNGDGAFYPAVLTEVSKKKIIAETGLPVQCHADSKLHTHIGQVISRGDRMDYAIQKATELGVSEITPLFSERCEVKLNQERQKKRLDHWQHIAISAAEQCGRASIPVIHPVQPLDQWVEGKQDNSLALVLHHRDTQNLNELSPPNRVSLLIGPEGGLSADEIARAQDAGFLSCTFGPRVFRTETAPVAAMSVLQWLWGDF